MPSTSSYRFWSLSSEANSSKDMSIFLIEAVTVDLPAYTLMLFSARLRKTFFYLWFITNVKYK